MLFTSRKSTAPEATERRPIKLILQLESGERLPAELSVSVTVEWKSAGEATDASVEERTVTFPVGAMSGAEREIVVTVVNDRIHEADETLVLKLARIPGATTDKYATHEFTIEDDDPLIIFTVAGDDQTVYEGKRKAAEPLDDPTGLALGAGGLLFVADPGNHKVRAINLESGVVSSLVNHSISNGFSGDGSPPKWALLTSPHDVALGTNGELFIADTGNGRIRLLKEGVISTVAGNGYLKALDPDVPAVETSIGSPASLAIDSQGGVFFSDPGGNRVLRLDLASSRVERIAGTGGSGGYSGDGGPATAAKLCGPGGICVGLKRDLYVADLTNNRIRRIDFATGRIETVAGTGERGYSGDGGPAIEAKLNRPKAVAVDCEGNLLICDTGNHRVRVVNVATGTITTLAGTGEPGYSGDGGPAHEAQLHHPVGILVSNSGEIYVSDARANRIRRIGPP